MLPVRRSIAVCSVSIFVCCVLDTVCFCNFSSVDVIHEDISLSIGDILKFVCSCVENFV